MRLVRDDDAVRLAVPLAEPHDPGILADAEQHASALRSAASSGARATTCRSNARSTARRRRTAPSRSARGPDARRCGAARRPRARRRALVHARPHRRPPPSRYANAVPGCGGGGGALSCAFSASTCRARLRVDEQRAAEDDGVVERENLRAAQRRFVEAAAEGVEPHDRLAGRVLEDRGQRAAGGARRRRSTSRGA